MSYIDCKNLVKAYQVSDHEIVALRGIAFSMERGEMVAIVGPSGAGKSSLLNLLGGLDTPTAGQLAVDGLNLLKLKGRRLADYRLRQVGFVWQNVTRNLLGHRSALDNVTLPMMLAGVGRRQRNTRAKDLLEAVGLADHMHKRPAQLSGGQQQRVAVAVALANQPPLLLADEPTGALDRKTGLQMMELIQSLRREFNLTILMVTHDMEVTSFADRTLTLRDGALGQDLTSSQEEHPRFDAEGRLTVPDLVRSHFGDGERIAVEIRPEGVLLRAEHAEEEGEFVLQDSLPDKPRRFRLRFWKRS
jgi:ABC-type lipoprotein export system ATPase subunit